MPTDSMLPGLDRLIAICQRHSLPLETHPPLASVPKSGETLLGQPIDPQLAAIYQRLGGGEFGPFSLLGPHSEEDGLIPQNQWLKERDQVQFLSSLTFGWKPGFAYYYGTVPKLANTQGLQPVIFISAMEELFAIPIASSVDRFFHLYSRYLESMVVDPDYVESGIPYVQFPWDMAPLVVQDEPLIERVRAGQFDFLTGNYHGALEWLQRLRSPPP
jgi:hypothetical protein